MPEKPTELPADFRARGLKSSAAHVIEAALQRGTISTREIAQLIPKETQRNPEQLSEAIAWIGDLLKARGITLVPERDELAHRKRHSAQEPKQPKRRKAKKKASSERKTRATQPDQLEIVGEQYEYDRLKTYHEEIARYPLLSAEEEAELGRRVLEEYDLDARDKLVMHNLRLVRWVARRYTWSGIPFEDLVQEGNIGLLTAAEKYDYRVGRFTTYATWWVRQTIARAVMDQSGTIRLPVHIQELRYKILKAAGEVASRTARTPSLEEVAKQAGVSQKKVRRSLQSMRIDTISLDERKRINKPGFGDEGRGPMLLETIPDERFAAPGLHLQAQQELEAARNRLNAVLEEVTNGLQLSARNLDVFNAFYGFDDFGRRRTLEAVGQRHGITRERARQIIARIWKRVDERGGSMDHNRLIAELIRIEELRKFVGGAVE